MNVLKVHKVFDISDAVRDDVFIESPAVTKLFVLYKTHKPGITIRPVVSFTSAPCTK